MPRVGFAAASGSGHIEGITIVDARVQASSRFSESILVRKHDVVLPHPLEILRHIVDHLHDEPATLKVCGVASKSRKAHRVLYRSVHTPAVDEAGKGPRCVRDPGETLPRMGSAVADGDRYGTGRRWQRALRLLSSPWRETTMSPSLPPEILDHIVDHLRDDPDTLKSYCVTSKSWVLCTRRHLFAYIGFNDSYSPALHLRRGRKWCTGASELLAQRTVSSTRPANTMTKGSWG